MKRRCSRCGKYFKIEDLYEAVDIRMLPLCKECVGKKLNKCPKCGNYYAERCTCEYERPKSIIPDSGSWRARKIPNYIGKAPWAGFEIEIELVNGEEDLNTLQKVYDKYDFLISKHDGSLNSKIELVTEPISLSLLKPGKRYYDKLSLMLRQLKEAGAMAETSTTAGLHIHIDNSMFTTADLYKLFSFFATNSEEITVFARRRKSEIERWASIIMDKRHIKKYIVEMFDQNRHTAINLNNLHTVEFRIFKGTLNPFTFWKNLQFIVALHKFLRTKPLYSDMKKYKWSDFVNYVLQNESGELYRYVRYYI